MASRAPTSGPPTRAPRPQRLLDDVFLLVAAGLIVPTIFYVLFGLLSIAHVPTFTP